jgi:hypothetical protein
MADAIHRDAPCLHLRVFTARPKFLKGFVGGRFVDNADGHPGMHNHILPEKRLGDTGQGRRNPSNSTSAMANRGWRLIQATTRPGTARHIAGEFCSRER